MSCNLALADKQISFLNWVNYIDPEILANFAKDTSINVRQSYFTGSLMLKTKLMIGNTGYDIALPALADMQQEIKLQLFTPLDKSKLSNYKNINKALYKKVSVIDKGNRYGIIYTYGTTGFAYNKQLVRKFLGKDAPVNSWDLVFSPRYLKKLKNCGISFLDSPRDMLGLMLHYLGINPNKATRADYQKAANYLKHLRPYLTYFSSDNYLADFSAGNLCLVVGYSGDIAREIVKAKHYNPNVTLKYVIPKEGAAVWFDMLVIPKDAKHRKLALKFLNYLLKPKVAAVISNFTLQPNAVNGSHKYLSKAVKNMHLDIPKTAFAKLFLIQSPPTQMNNYINQLWFKVKYGL